MMKYTIKCNKKYLSDIKKLHIKDLIIDEETITFQINDIKKLKDFEIIEEINNHKLRIKKIFKFHSFMIIFLLLILSFFYLMNKSISKIIFKDEDMYSKSVYEKVKSYLDDYLVFNFLNEDLITINKELRSEFYNYQWIGVKKEGNVLLIDIIDNKDNLTNSSDEKESSLYSSCDTVIEGYYIKQGSSTIKLNRSVKKGELLISGNIKHYDDVYEKVTAEGYVIGVVNEDVIIEVPITNDEIKRSGRKESKTLFIFNNKNINNPKCSFENFETEYKTIINLGFLKVYKIIFYELIEDNIYNTEEKAVETALNIVDDEFYKNKKYDFEEIIAKRIISKSKNEYNYVFCIKIKKKIDICIPGPIDTIDNNVN